MKVYVWLPAEGNRYGHVALETDRYYASFWPRGDIKADGETVQAATSGVDADLVYHRDLDYHLEGRRLPEQVVLPGVSDAAVNDVLERFFRDNDVVPEDVTLEAAEAQVEKFLSTRHSDDRPEKRLSRTRYNYVAKFDCSCFTNIDSLLDLRDPQSCTSFVMNTIVLSFPPQKMGLLDLIPEDPFSELFSFFKDPRPLTVPKFLEILLSNKVAPFEQNWRNFGRKLIRFPLLMFLGSSSPALVVISVGSFLLGYWTFGLSVCHIINFCSPALVVISVGSFFLRKIDRYFACIFSMVTTICIGYWTFGLSVIINIPGLQRLDDMTIPILILFFTLVFLVFLSCTRIIRF